MLNVLAPFIRIYLYDVTHLDKGPAKIFSGSKIESFYVKVGSYKTVSIPESEGVHALDLTIFISIAVSN